MRKLFIGGVAATAAIAFAPVVHAYSDTTYVRTESWLRCAVECRWHWFWIGRGV
jgi:hypothetical protein